MSGSSSQLRMYPFVDHFSFSGTRNEFCTVEAGLSQGAPPEWIYVHNMKPFARIVSENSRDWLDYAAQYLPQDVVDDGIVFVTGTLKGYHDWEMYCKINDHPTFGSSKHLCY